MGLPILLLFVFLIKACTLEGAEDGIKAYIGEWDMSVLKDRPDVWSTAVSQIFFSLSVTFGTMTAYGSGCPRGEPAFVNSVVVGISNSMFSILSGFAVFAAMGHLAFQQGVTVDEIPYAGFSLVFGTWPVVMGSLPGGAHWVRLLFFDLFLLGIDSAFSILEGPLAVVMDRTGMEGVPKWKAAALFSFIAFLLSLIYATDSGLIFLDSVDFYINFVLLLTGFFETFGAGWIYHIEEQITKLGPEIVFTYMFTNFGSVIVASGLWFGLKSNAVWGGFVGFFLCYFAGLGVTYMLLSKKMAQEPEWTWNSIIYELCLKNVMDLRNELSEVVGYMPWIWAFGMKNIIPHILLILFINLAQSENDDGKPLFGNYGGYITWPFQVIGILCVAFAASLILVGIAMPVIYEPYDIPYRKSLEAEKAPQKELESMETGDKKEDSSGDEEVAREEEVEAEA
jgi:solute carrier family 6 GABA transporter-like protein 1